MKIVRFLVDDSILWGELDGETIRALSESPLKSFTLSGKQYSLGQVKLLAPAERPTHVVGVALNYPGVSGESAIADEPLFFLKSPTSISAITDPVTLPVDASRGFWGEVELACVMSRDVYQSSVAECEDAILGYCIANDLTLENLANRDHHLLRSKALTGFCPMGPYLDTSFDPNSGKIWSKINGTTSQEADLSEMLYSPQRCVSLISQLLPLTAGDVVLFGTPSGAGATQQTGLRAGDEFELGIAGLGSVTQQIVDV